jgi:hypothetical protein
MIKHALFILVCSVTLTSCENRTSINYNNPNNGDLNNSFKETDPQKLAEMKEKVIKDSLLQAGWTEAEMENGSMPSCYNFKPKQNKSINNYLEINVGGGTDVVVKLLEFSFIKN